MTRQTWTAIVSAILFVVSAAAIAMVPVPYVVWSPGGTHDLLARRDGVDIVGVSGVTTYPTQGQLRLTTVAMTRSDAALTLPEALYAHWAANREAIPRDAIYQPGQSVSELRERERLLMDTSQEDAVAAAMTEAGLKVERVPAVLSVATVGPAADKLLPGDQILKVDGGSVSSISEVVEAIAKHEIGDAVIFQILRDGERSDVAIVTESSRTRKGMPIVGVQLTLGYSHAAKVDFGVDPAIGGSSAGLMFALAVYDKVTPGSLVGNRTIAGTGTITGEGEVGPVGAIHEKLAAAERDGASVFLLPRANCADLGVEPHQIRIVAVGTLDEAAGAVESLADPAREAGVKGCS